MTRQSLERSRSVLRAERSLLKIKSPSSALPTKNNKGRAPFCGELADCSSVRHIHPHVGKIAARKVRPGDGHHQVVDISAGEQREMVRRQLKKHDGFRHPLDELRAPASRLTTQL